MVQAISTETLKYVKRLNQLTKLLKPSCGMSIAHNHHDWLEININRLDGKTYFASAKMEYIQNLENTLTPMELVNALFKMGIQQGTYA